MNNAVKIFADHATFPTLQQFMHMPEFNHGMFLIKGSIF